MGSILIRQLDDETKSKLRLRAARNGHSMEQEARDILQHSLASEGSGGLHLVDAIRRRMKPLGGVELPIIPRDPVPEPLKLDE
ncbi:MAG: plasmid stabilization protein [Candidatus Solibacter sp.]|jgi:plasmid stability protein